MVFCRCAALSHFDTYASSWSHFKAGGKLSSLIDWSASSATNRQRQKWNKHMRPTCKYPKAQENRQ